MQQTKYLCIQMARRVFNVSENTFRTAKPSEFFKACRVFFPFKSNVWLGDCNTWEAQTVATSHLLTKVSKCAFIYLFLTGFSGVTGNSKSDSLQMSDKWCIHHINVYKPVDFLWFNDVALLLNISVFAMQSLRSDNQIPILCIVKETYL